MGLVSQEICPGKCYTHLGNLILKSYYFLKLLILCPYLKKFGSCTLDMYLFSYSMLVNIKEIQLVCYEF